MIGGATLRLTELEVAGGRRRMGCGRVAVRGRHGPWRVSRRPTADPRRAPRIAGPTASSGPAGRAHRPAPTGPILHRPASTRGATARLPSTTASARTERSEGSPLPASSMLRERRDGFRAAPVRPGLRQARQLRRLVAIVPAGGGPRRRGVQRQRRRDRRLGPRALRARRLARARRGPGGAVADGRRHPRSHRLRATEPRVHPQRRKNLVWMEERLLRLGRVRPRRPTRPDQPKQRRTRRPRSVRQDRLDQWNLRRSVIYTEPGTHPFNGPAAPKI